jgi:hypothetical protein
MLFDKQNKEVPSRSWYNSAISTFVASLIAGG